MAAKNKTIEKSLSPAVLRPRITENAAVLSGGDVYTFDVSKGFNKIEIARAIEAIYKVKPVKVNIVTIPRKKIIYRGKPGVKGGGKKALVHLKKGDKIEFV